MGTVEKIVEVLNKMCNDRKLQTTTNYEIHSNWLKNEINKVKDLLKTEKNEVKNEVKIEKTEKNEVNEVNEIKDLKNISLQDTKINSEEESEKRSKRKSPELSDCSISRGSPQIKRISNDFNEILLSYGLPSDLNKLKKEELLEYLIKYGNSNNLTMKSLKKDLIDGLKVLLIELYYNKNNISKNINETFDLNDNSIIQTSNSTSVSSSSEVIPSSSSLTSSTSSSSSTTATSLTSTTLSQPINGSPARKVSMLAEVRHQVRSSILQEKVETEEDRQNRLAKEYEARRNRSSQVRMSHISSIPGQEGPRSRSASVNSVSSTSGQDDMISSQELQSQSQQQSQTLIASDDDEEEGELEVVTSNDIKIEEEFEEEPDEHNNNWNEVPSPPPPVKPILPNSQGEKKNLGQQSLQQEFNSAEEQSEDIESSVQHNTTDPSHSTFKLSNLVGGTQISFLSNSSSHTNNKPKEKAVVSNFKYFF